MVVKLKWKINSVNEKSLTSDSCNLPYTMKSKADIQTNKVSYKKPSKGSRDSMPFYSNASVYRCWSTCVVAFISIDISDIFPGICMQKNSLVQEVAYTTCIIILVNMRYKC